MMLWFPFLLFAGVVFATESAQKDKPSDDNIAMVRSNLYKADTSLVFINPNPDIKLFDLFTLQEIKKITEIIDIFSNHTLFTISILHDYILPVLVNGVELTTSEKERLVEFPNIHLVLKPIVEKLLWASHFIHGDVKGTESIQCAAQLWSQLGLNWVDSGLHHRDIGTFKDKEAWKMSTHAMIPILATARWFLLRWELIFMHTTKACFVSHRIRNGEVPRILVEKSFPNPLDLFRGIFETEPRKIPLDIPFYSPFNIKAFETSRVEFVWIREPRAEDRPIKMNIRIPQPQPANEKIRMARPARKTAYFKEKVEEQTNMPARQPIPVIPAPILQSPNPPPVQVIPAPTLPPKNPQMNQQPFRFIPPTIPAPQNQQRNEQPLRVIPAPMSPPKNPQGTEQPLRAPVNTPSTQQATPIITDQMMDRAITNEIRNSLPSYQTPAQRPLKLFEKEDIQLNHYHLGSADVGSAMKCTELEPKNSPTKTKEENQSRRTRSRTKKPKQLDEHVKMKRPSTGASSKLKRTRKSKINVGTSTDDIDMSTDKVEAKTVDQANTEMLVPNSLTNWTQTKLPAPNQSVNLRRANIDPLPKLDHSTFSEEKFFANDGSYLDSLLN